MKCPKCGYVSFDDVDICKGCGAVMGDKETEELQESSPLQDELFNDGPDETDDAEPADDKHQEVENTLPFDEPQPEAAAAAVELPDMDIDYDPAEEEPAAPPSEPGDAAEGDIDESPRDGQGEYPDELWLEESAGFFLRAEAFAIDALLLLSVLLLFGLGAWVALDPGALGLGAFASAGVIIAFYLLGLLISLCYYTFFVGWSGRTPGKGVLRLEVRRSDGGPMTYGRAFLRWAGYLVSFTFAGLGFFWIIFDERKKGWHDYLSGTWVKDLRHEE